MKAAAVFASLLIAAPAQAEEAESWGVIGNWGIYVDASLNDGCFAMVTYTDDSFFRAGFDQVDSGAYLYFWRPEWQSLQPGQTYFIEVHFGEIEVYWDGDATAHEFPDGSRYLRFWSTDFELLDDVLNEDSARIVYEGKEIASFDLTDSDQAMLGVMQCQDEMDGKSAPSGDDPFQQ